MRMLSVLASVSIMWVMAVAFGAWSVSSANAQTRDARAHFQRGRAAYQQGAYEQAIDEWKKAYELDPRPLLQFNLAQAYERLGQLRAAVDALETYVQNAEPEDGNQAPARAKLGALKERLARTGIHITGGADGARVEIDGKAWGRLPRPDPIKVDPGRHTVRVEMPGYDAFRSDVVVPAGQVIEVDVELEADEPDSAAASARRPQEQVQGSETLATADASSPTRIDWLPYGLMIGGGTAVVTGAILGAVALSKADGAVDGSDDAETARGLALGADIAIVAGLVAGGAGLVLLLTDEGQPTERAAKVRIAPQVGAGRLGLQATGRF